jgi:hypothetical protein
LGFPKGVLKIKKVGGASECALPCLGSADNTAPQLEAENETVVLGANVACGAEHSDGVLPVRDTNHNRANARADREEVELAIRDVLLVSGNATNPSILVLVPLAEKAKDSVEVVPYLGAWARSELLFESERKLPIANLGRQWPGEVWSDSK